jgi:hypothetical protein
MSVLMKEDGGWTQMNCSKASSDGHKRKIIDSSLSYSGDISLADNDKKGGPVIPPFAPPSMRELMTAEVP